MTSAISLKGLTTCTPEFHRIAKAAELEAEAGKEEQEDGERD